MDNSIAVNVGLGLLVVLAVWIQIKLFSMYNSRDGERIARTRAQGPFVPLDDAEVKARR